MEPFIVKSREDRFTRLRVLATNPAMMDYLCVDESTKEFSILLKDELFKNYIFVKSTEN